MIKCYVKSWGSSCIFYVFAGLIKPSQHETITRKFIAFIIFNATLSSTCSLLSSLRNLTLESVLKFFLFTSHEKKLNSNHTLNTLILSTPEQAKKFHAIISETVWNIQNKKNSSLYNNIPCLLKHYHTYCDL